LPNLDKDRTILLRQLLLVLRSALFYFGYSILTVWFSVTGVVLGTWMPYHVRINYLAWWNFATLHWLAWTCGVRYQVQGRENLPAGSCVILSKHQSQWETYFLQVLKMPVVTVLKRELLHVPFFGWGLRLLEPIAIDRNNPKQALKHIMAEGARRLAEGRSVMIFPEGTRTPPGQVGNYARSGATLACKAGVPIVPVAHNSGRYWPARRFIKYPGTIQVIIGAPIDTTDGDGRTLTETVKNWIEAEQTKLDSTVL
jgi:1-acyl-sn-glycerol-3-phosphate acyltransferase